SSPAADTLRNSAGPKPFAASPATATRLAAPARFLRGPPAARREEVPGRGSRRHLSTPHRCPADIRRDGPLCAVHHDKGSALCATARWKTSTLADTPYGGRTLAQTSPASNLLPVIDLLSCARKRAESVPPSVPLIARKPADHLAS